MTTNSRGHQQLRPHITEHRHTNKSAKHRIPTDFISRYHHGVQYTVQPDIVADSPRTIIRPPSNHDHN